MGRNHSGNGALANYNFRDIDGLRQRYIHKYCWHEMPSRQSLNIMVLYHVSSTLLFAYDYIDLIIWTVLLCCWKWHWYFTSYVNIRLMLWIMNLIIKRIEKRKAFLLSHIVMFITTTYHNLYNEISRYNCLTNCLNTTDW